jgi:hypothetical protein
MKGIRVESVVLARKDGVEIPPAFFSRVRAVDACLCPTEKPADALPQEVLGLPVCSEGISELLMFDPFKQPLSIFKRNARANAR